MEEQEVLVTVGAWETETVAGQVAAAHHQRKVRLSHAPLLPPLKPRWRGEHSDPPTYQRLYHQKVRWNPVSTDYS